MFLYANGIKKGFNKFAETLAGDCVTATGVKPVTF